MTHYGDDLVPGTRLEEFEIERTLGTGGFGVTYLAWDRSLDRRVAIKEYLPRDWGSRRADGSVGPRSAGDVKDFRWGLDRFLAEARILAKLEHPHIVRVHRIIAATRGTAYMVMEYVEGRSLREELAEEGALSETRVHGILMALTAGLEPVHEKGLLHRDIKPANVMLRAKDGTPVLIDFGAARQVMGQQSRSVTSVLTPGYAPIELYETHGNQGPWTDIYSLGALAYVALTRRLPQDATSRVRHDSLAPLAESALEAVSSGLAEAVATALRVNESDRPQDLHAWRALLEASNVGEDGTPAREASGPAEAGNETAPVGQEGMPAVLEGPSVGNAGTPAAEDGTFAADGPLFGAEPDETPPDYRWRMYGVAAGIAGAALLGVLLMVWARSGGEGGTDTGTATRAAAGGGVEDARAAADAGDERADAGTATGVAAGGAAEAGAATDDGDATDDGGATEPSTEMAGDVPTGREPDDGDDAARVEAALGLDRNARRAIQEGLVAAGLDPGVLDGSFGDRTRAALREWQAGQGMAETGYLDRTSAEALAAEASSAEAPVAEAASAEVLVAELERSPPPSPDPPTATPLETPDEDRVPTPSEPNPPPTVEPTRDVDLPPAPRTVFRSCPDCPEMVVVPSGTFRMGSSEGQDDERPVHNVRIDTFAIGRYEVTRGEYAAFVAATDHSSAGCNVVDDQGEQRWDPRASWLDPGFAQQDQHPVVCVGWEDAATYIRWLRERTDERYRLASEAEWEYAARAGTVSRRYWDGGSTGQCDNANGGDSTLQQRFRGWSAPFARCADGGVHTTLVGAYEPNAFRLYDMLGNVWEWVADCWHADYQGAPSDGSAWREDNCSGRVWRGGSWDTPSIGIRAANRFISNDGGAHSTAGFRVVREYQSR